MSRAKYIDVRSPIHSVVRAIFRIIVVIVIAIIAIFITAFVSFMILWGRTSGPTLNQEQIIQFVLDNEELLNNAVAEIFAVDEHVSRIAHTNFTRLHARDEFDFEGLYTGGVIGIEYVTKPLNSPILYELLRDGIIRSIGITRADPLLRTTYQIDFAFSIRSARYRYGGIYFSKNDEPILFHGGRWLNPETYRNGWVSYGGHFYYTERIVPHWFFYEMLHSSDRRPGR